MSGTDDEDADCVHNPILIGAIQMLAQMAHDPRFVRRDVADMGIRTVLENALAVKALAQVTEIVSGASAKMLADLADVGWDWHRFVNGALARGDVKEIDPTEFMQPKRKTH